jgi:hypothetical protein
MKEGRVVQLLAIVRVLGVRSGAEDACGSWELGPQIRRMVTSGAAQKRG